MPKRKASSEGDAITDEPLRRSTRQKASRSGTSTAAAVTKGRTQRGESDGDGGHLKSRATKKSSSKAAVKTEPPAKKSRQTNEYETAEKPAGPSKSEAETDVENAIDDRRQYWLMKAEPETRLENGVDVSFSIDNLAAKKDPEPWDGIRAYAARNNLRAMKKGDLAFFYHSNCKEPGIVGTMEIVEEHSPDLSAHDPKAPYYDASSKPSDPKWSVVHVKFRSKFAVPIGLKELRTYCAPGKPLENMQMLKQSRLSVSKVNATEWNYLNELAEKKAEETGS